MTDQDHYERVKAALDALTTALNTAGEAGLVTEVTLRSALRRARAARAVHIIARHGAADPGRE